MDIFLHICNHSAPQEDLSMKKPTKKTAFIAPFYDPWRVQNSFYLNHNAYFFGFMGILMKISTKSQPWF